MPIQPRLVTGPLLVVAFITVLAARALRTQDPAELTAQVHIVLGRVIGRLSSPDNTELQVMACDPALERTLLQAATGKGVVIESELAHTLAKGAQAAATHQEQLGLPAVLVVS